MTLGELKAMHAKMGEPSPKMRNYFDGADALYNAFPVLVERYEAMRAALAEAKKWVPGNDRMTPAGRGAVCSTLGEAHEMFNAALDLADKPLMEDAT